MKARAEKQTLPQQEGFYERKMISYELFLTFDSSYSKTISLVLYMYTNRFFLNINFVYFTGKGVIVD